MYALSQGFAGRGGPSPELGDSAETATAVEVLPLAFPHSRWSSFGVEDQARFNRAQCILDAIGDRVPRNVFALHEDTGLDDGELGEALALLEDLGLVELDEFEEELSVALVATPEEHIGVRFPDGQIHWVFVSRPVVEPDVPLEELN